MSGSASSSHRLGKAHVVSPCIFGRNVQGVVVLSIAPSVEIAEDSSKTSVAAPGQSYL